MKRRNQICGLLLFLVITPGESAWDLRKTANNISIYTRNALTSDFKEIKCSTKVKSSLTSAVMVLIDIEHYPDWIYNCIEATVIKKTSESEIYSYQLFDVPWPSSDRDVISRMCVRQDSITKVVTIQSDLVNDLIPEKDGIVRVKEFHSTYKLTPMPDGWVNIDYEMGTDPGGIVPAWLVNLVIVNAPYSTQEKMNDLVQDERYKSGHLDFISDF